MNSPTNLQATGTTHNNKKIAGTGLVLKCVKRKIYTDLIRKKYDEIGLEYPEVVDKFLKEYGMLNINPGDKCYFDVSFNAIEAIGCNLDGSYFKECLAEYDINETVYPIGEACRKPIETE